MKLFLEGRYFGVTRRVGLALLVAVVGLTTPACLEFGGDAAYSRDASFNLVDGIQYPQSNPQWSPKGDVIAFMYDGGIYTVTAEGSDLRFLDGQSPSDKRVPPEKGGYRGRFAVSPSVSPDRTLIAYAAFDGRWKILVSSLDGSSRRSLTKTKTQGIIYMNPTWSPDGKRIAFVSNLNFGEYKNGERTLADYTVFTMASDGSDVRSVAPSIRARGSAPVWSPDGRSLAFLAHDTELGTLGGVLYTVNLDGSGLTRIGETTTQPTWSPDGTRIAFTRWEDEGSTTRIYTSAPDGSEPTVLHGTGDQGFFFVRNLLWSPDGTAILYSNGYALVVVDADGAKARKLVDFVGLHEEVRASWRQDGWRIAVYVSRKEDSILSSPRSGVLLLSTYRDGVNVRVLAKAVEDSRVEVDEQLVAAGGEFWP